jgi:hypothetical protein
MCGNRGYSIHGQYAPCIFNTCFVVELHPGQPSWITNRFKKIQNFFRTPRGTFVILLVTWHTVVLKKKLKMWKVTNMRINGWTDGHQTLFNHKSSASGSGELESGLIRGVAFGGNGLIRGVAFGGNGLIRGWLLY